MGLGKISKMLVVGCLLTMPMQSMANSTYDEVKISKVKSITLSSDENDKVKWMVEGDSDKGFKVVWSKNPGATYPTRKGDKYQYLSDSSQRGSNKLTTFDGDGKYYVRVCEYLGGKCGVYSNEVEVELKGELETGEKNFSDVSKNNENYEAIYYLKNKEVIKGYEDFKYKPNQPINRAEFLKIIMEISDYKLEGSSCFKDVKTEWYAKYVCKASKLGLIEGYKDGYYRPNRDINFAEASKIIIKTLLIEINEENNENWYHRFVVAMEMLSAIPSSINNFDKKVTRGEMAEMIYRVDAKKTGKKSKSYIDLKSYELEEKKEEPNSISLRIKNEGNNKVSWSATESSTKGFKVVWSKVSNPTYPTRSTDKYQYFSDSERRSSNKLTTFKGEGKYYVRVCEYLGGACGAYSNQIIVDLN